MARHTHCAWDCWVPCLQLLQAHLLGARLCSKLLAHPAPALLAWPTVVGSIVFPQNCLKIRFWRGVAAPTAGDGACHLALPLPCAEVTPQHQQLEVSKS